MNVHCIWQIKGRATDKIMTTNQTGFAALNSECGARVLDEPIALRRIIAAQEHL